MNNYEKIYWLTRMDSIHDLLQGATTICIVGVILSLIFYPIISMAAEDFSDEPEKLKRSVSRARIVMIVVGIISAIALTLAPTKNEMIVIYAGGKTLDYVQADTSLQKIPFQATKYISDYLEKSLKEMKDEKPTSK